MTNNSKEIDVHPDTWARFKFAAGYHAKAPPQHWVAKERKIAKKAKKRPSK